MGSQRLEYSTASPVTHQLTDAEEKSKGQPGCELTTEHAIPEFCIYWKIIVFSNTMREATAGVQIKLTSYSFSVATTSTAIGKCSLKVCWGNMRNGSCISEKFEAFSNWHIIQVSKAFPMQVLDKAKQRTLD